MRDLKNNIYVSQLRAVADDNGVDAYSYYIDLGVGSRQSLVIGVMMGTAAGTLSSSVKLVPTLYEATATPLASASYSAVAAANIEGAFTTVDAAGEDALTQWVGYKGTARYVLVYLNYTGATGAWPIGVVAITANSGTQPEAAPTTAALTS